MQFRHTHKEATLTSVAILSDVRPHRRPALRNQLASTLIFASRDRLRGSNHLLRVEALCRHFP
jgi:hypothetical protein